jgi:hypothetical protein
VRPQCDLDRLKFQGRAPFNNREHAEELNMRAVILAVALLAGCANHTQYVIPPGMSDEEANRRLYACQRDVALAQFGSDIMDSCMRAAGFKRQGEP